MCANALFVLAGRGFVRWGAVWLGCRWIIGDGAGATGDDDDDGVAGLDTPC